MNNTTTIVISAKDKVSLACALTNGIDVDRLYGVCRSRCKKNWFPLSPLNAKMRHFCMPLQAHRAAGPLPPPSTAPSRAVRATHDVVRGNKANVVWHSGSHRVGWLPDHMSWGDDRNSMTQRLSRIADLMGQRIDVLFGIGSSVLSDCDNGGCDQQTRAVRCLKGKQCACNNV